MGVHESTLSKSAHPRYDQHFELSNIQTWNLLRFEDTEQLNTIVNQVCNQYMVSKFLCIGFLFLAVYVCDITAYMIPILLAPNMKAQV
jgi:hypothetical protein